MKLIKIISLNLAILFTILVFAEIISRVIYTFNACLKQTNCNYSKLYKFETNLAKESIKNLNLSSYDDELGFVPSPGFNQIINLKSYGWFNNKVTINNDGFRSNDNSILNNNEDYKALIVGDSFTFGDQVDNNETWPSCLERKLNIKIANAGVFSYGAAQSLKRAIIEKQKRNYEIIILSVLVNSNFKRDRYTHRVGLPRPAVIKDNDKIYWKKVPPYDQLGTRYNPEKKLGWYFVNYSVFFYYLNEIFNLQHVLSKHFKIDFKIYDLYLSKEDKNAATIEEIVNFTLKTFNNLDTKKKYLVLQYKKNDFLNDKSSKLKLRNYILNMKLNNIKIIDTYNDLDYQKKISEKKIWYGNKHHTPYGNELVCNTIVKNF